MNTVIHAAFRRDLDRFDAAERRWTTWQAPCMLTWTTKSGISSRSRRATQRRRLFGVGGCTQAGGRRYRRYIGVAWSAAAS